MIVENFKGQTHRLRGRKALITGATRGIGLAIAEEYARHGADLVLTASSVNGLPKVKDRLKRYGVGVKTFAADLASDKEIVSLFSFALGEEPELDILVNNAGIHVGKSFTEHTMEDFNRVMRINVSSVFRLSQLAVCHMIRLGRGKIVNISSVAGLKGSVNSSAYNTSKHALIGLTKCIALEIAKKNIQVNAVCPGIVETDIIRNFEKKVVSTGVSSEEFWTSVENQNPMGRMLQPSEIAHIAVFLASSESDGMTGQTITI